MTYSYGASLLQSVNYIKSPWSEQMKHCSIEVRLTIMVYCEIMVTNTGTFPQTLSEFTDPHCDDGTIAGGPGTDRLTPGDSVTYTCGHVLDAAGAYTNEARVTATTLCCETLTQTSNQVVVEVPGRPPPPQKPEFTIEKLQEIAGSKAGFTTSPLTGAVGQTVEYQIVVT